MRESWTGLHVVCCAAALAGVVNAQSIGTPAPATTRPSVDTLIEQLGDYRYSVRAEATARLSKLQSDFLAELVRRYRDEPRYERKLRLRYVIESVYYRKLMDGQAGFLGITPWPIVGVYDPKTGQAAECIVVETVVKDNAAQIAGIREKDIILDFDGRPISKVMNSVVPRRPGDDQQMALAGRSAELEAFTSHVKMREPGSKIPMRVLRAGEARKVRVPVGPRPDAMVDARTLASTIMSGDQSSGVGAAAGGLVVTHVPERSWLADAGLHVNDAMVSVEGSAIPPGGTAETLERAFAASGPGRSVLLEVRKLEQVELTVTLGARPVNMMNQPDKEEAQRRFATWWQKEMGERSIRISQPRLAHFVSAMPAVPVAPEPQLVP